MMIMLAFFMDKTLTSVCRGEIEELGKLRRHEGKEDKQTERKKEGRNEEGRLAGGRAYVIRVHG